MNPETALPLPPILKHLTSENLLLMVAAVVAARVLAAGIKVGFSRLAKNLPPRWRIVILAWMPIARLLVVLATTAFIVSLLIVPSWQNVVGLIAGAGLVLSFALKDYGSCLLAGLATIFERAYQPGDWIEIGGAYGEVRSVGLRSVRLVTLDDTEVIVPHSAIWASAVYNATSGNHTVLCVAEFFLHPDHDGLLVQERLREIAVTSPLWLAESPVIVIVEEQPWGTKYRLKAYVRDSREQKKFTTDLTLRSKAVFRELGIKAAQAAVAVGR
ncbi:MAG: mechanosensitive ion channel [Verrucomicrobia bacterium]|nr:mechanosensitive ion channel [Verrucomicrobiota bacterium]